MNAGCAYGNFGGDLPRTRLGVYYLDESDPDIVVLRRQDGAFVVAFSASGATKEGILQAAEEDYVRLAQGMTQARVEVYHRR